MKQFRAVRWLMLYGAAVAILGCNRAAATPQQQFFDALNNNQGAAASQIWLQMSPEDRAKLQRGEGLGPQISADQVQAQLKRHTQEGGANDTGTDIPNFPASIGGALKAQPNAP